jgi:hypothetical protein
VGKSSILLRFTEGTYNSHQASTIGRWVDGRVRWACNGQRDDDAHSRPSPHVRLATVHWGSAPLVAQRVVLGGRCCWLHFSTCFCLNWPPPVRPTPPPRPHNPWPRCDCPPHAEGVCDKCLAHGGLLRPCRAPGPVPTFASLAFPVLAPLSAAHAPPSFAGAYNAAKAHRAHSRVSLYCTNCFYGPDAAVVRGWWGATHTAVWWGLVGWRGGWPRQVTPPHVVWNPPRAPSAHVAAAQTRAL